MAYVNRVGFVAVLCALTLAGCSGGNSSNASATASTDGGQPAAQADTASNPVARAASDWLDAVLKGDKQRANARLTPQAQEQIQKSNMEFSPPGGMQNASFQIGEVRTPAQDQAIVQCVLNFSANGQQQSEESCCLLRLVDNQWRVAGIAYGSAADKPWTLTNFETGQDMPIPRQTMTPANTSADANGSNRPSPPRTAQEAPAAAPRSDLR